MPFACLIKNGDAVRITRTPPIPFYFHLVSEEDVSLGEEHVMQICRSGKSPLLTAHNQEAEEKTVEALHALGAMANLKQGGYYYDTDVPKNITMPRHATPHLMSKKGILSDENFGDIQEDESVC